jgi:16S rRNA (cytidine1402-2'-O)-methyltransferase
VNVQKSFADGAERRTGALYLVATPIGNLEDMTWRAVRTLREADVIAAEDTRQTRKLLSHFQISGQLVSYHEHNKESSGKELVRRMMDGQQVALVSDAGVPAVSDPGYELVQAAIEAGIPVVPVPGANAALSALIVSGLPTDAFLYAGFLPRRGQEAAKQLARWRRVPCTLVFYEAPHRLERTLELMLEVLGDRRVALARELTKKHEEIARGRIRECLEWIRNQPPRGEYCIVVEGGGEADDAEPAGQWWHGLDVREHVERYERQGHSRKDAMKLAAKDRGVSKRDIYRELV